MDMNETSIYLLSPQNSNRDYKAGFRAKPAVRLVERSLHTNLVVELEHGTISSAPTIK